MNIFRGIQERVSGVVLGAIAGVVVFLCGALMAFVISPQQAIEWRRIQNLPELDANGVQAAPSGQEIAMTGYLAGNTALTTDGLVAYEKHQWAVRTSTSTSEDGETSTPSGSWESLKTNIPVLNVNISGGTVSTVAATSVDLGGNYQETIERGASAVTADYDGSPLPEGSIRTQGFQDGDLVTIVGNKSSVGGVTPDRIYGGDRNQLVEDIRGGARALFASGVGMMICGPILAAAIIAGSIFGRRRRSVLGA
jgi:hypothetical protein